MKLQLKTVLQSVLEHLEQEPLNMFQDTRKTEEVYARQLFWYLAKKWTRKSLADIGKVSVEYGRNQPHDHCTVRYGKIKIDGLLSVRKQVLEDVRCIELALLKHGKKKMTPEQIAKENDMYELKDAILNLCEKDEEIRALKKDIETLKKDGLKDDEIELLNLYRGLPDGRKKDTMYKVRVAHKINMLAV